MKYPPGHRVTGRPQSSVVVKGTILFFTKVLLDFISDEMTFWSIESLEDLSPACCGGNGNYFLLRKKLRYMRKILFFTFQEFPRTYWD